MDGACWSPDSRNVAASVAFWSTYNLGPKLDAGWELKPDDYTLTIYDARTGRAQRRIRGATQPSWGG